MWLSEFYTFAKAILCLYNTLVYSIFIHIRQKEKILNPYDKCEPGLIRVSAFWLLI